MSDVAGVILAGVLFALFVYYGYKDDFKRAHGEFIKTIIGVPIGFFASILGAPAIAEQVKRWIKDNKQ